MKEFKSYTLKTGLTTNLTVKQGMTRIPPDFYKRPHNAYFRPNNEIQII